MGCSQTKDRLISYQELACQDFTQKALSAEDKQLHKELLSSAKGSIKSIEKRYKSDERLLVNRVDRRKLVDEKDLKSLPYSAILRLESNFEDDILFAGSGVLIGRFHALTVAHNVFDSGSKRWARSIRVIPAQKGDKEPFGHTYACHVYKFTNCDLAVLKLEIPIGDLTKWMRIGQRNSINDLRKKTLTLAGYPNKKKEIRHMYTHEGELKSFSNTKITYDIDTSKGQSGSPIWIEQDSSEYIVIAVHSGCGASYEGANCGLLLSEDRSKQIKTWVDQSENSFETRDSFDQLSLENLTTEKAFQKLQEKWKNSFLNIVKIGEELWIERVWDQRTRIIDNHIKNLIKDVAMKGNGQPQNIWKSFLLDMSCCDQLTDEALRSIGSELGGRLYYIQKLRLCFDECNRITDKGIRDLVIQIGANLCNLQKLSLDFKGCKYITDGGIKSLASQIKLKFSTLKELSLDFSWCFAITDKGIKYLAEEIGENLLDLQALSLDFNWCDEITEEGIKNFGFLLFNESLKRLKSLMLDFSSLITDKALSELTTQIGTGLPDLSELSLIFDSCPRITDQGISNIAFLLGNNHNNLKKLKLDFNSCEEITDQGIQILAVQIKNHLPYLKNLILDFSFCPKITYKSKKVVEDSLYYVPLLGIDIWADI